MLDYTKVLSLREKDKKSFAELIFQNYEPRFFFCGEIPLKKVVQDKKGVSVQKDVFIFLTEDEKNKVIELHKELFYKKKKAILDEGERRYLQAIEREELKELYIDPEMAMIINMAFDGEDVEHKVFKNACFALYKNKEINGAFWKSYLFKGFLTKNQVEQLMTYSQKDKNPEKIINVKTPVKV